MKQPIVRASLLALGVAALSLPAAADSAVEQRFREEGRGLDLTGFLQPENDARSRSFFYGGVHEHDFTVREAGTYLFESSVPGGESEDYRVTAVLLDGQGREIARAQALGQDGGLALRERLEPGDYALRVEGHKFGTRSRQGNSFYITVAGLDAEGQRRDEAVSEGQGIFFSGDSRDGSRTAFVRSDEAVATIAAPAALAAPAAPAAASSEVNRAATASVSAAGAAAGTAAAGAAAGSASTASVPEAALPEARTSVASASPAPTSPAEPTPPAAPAPQAEPQTFEAIVTDVKIRARGEVLTFEVAERGTIAITTSTYPSGYEDTYRIELEVLDAGGRTVAEGAGQGFDGDVDLETVLEPGRYRIRVQGQKFGSAHSGVNNYELRVVQRDRR